jgi:hypothetical protein
LSLIHLAGSGDDEAEDCCCPGVPGFWHSALACDWIEEFAAVLALLGSEGDEFREQ